LVPTAWLDLRPQHAGGVDQHGELVQVELLLGLGDGRLVADLGHALLQQGVHQRRLADVGNAHDHDAQRLGRHAAVRRQGLAQLGDPGHVGRLLGRHRVGRDAGLGVVPGGPLRGRGGVGQVGLVQHLQAGALAELAQLFDHRVAARLRQARVQDLDDHIGVFHLLRGLLAGGGHVAREPLNRHFYLKISVQSAILRCRPR